MSQLAHLRDVKDSAKDSIREMGSYRAARLQSAYNSLRRRGLRAVGARGTHPEVEVLGRDGPLRVRKTCGACSCLLRWRRSHVPLSCVADWAEPTEEHSREQCSCQHHVSVLRLGSMHSSDPCL